MSAQLEAEKLALAFCAQYYPHHDPHYRDKMQAIDVSRISEPNQALWMAFCEGADGLDCVQAFSASLQVNIPAHLDFGAVLASLEKEIAKADQREKVTAIMRTKDPDSVWEQLADLAMSETNKAGKQDFQSAAEIMLSERFVQAVPMTPNGLATLDEALDGGMAIGDASIIAARPGMGKTSFASSCMYHRAVAGLETGFVTMEMQDLRLVRRLLGTSCRVSANKIAKNPEAWRGESLELMQRCHIYDDSSKDYRKICQKIRAHHSRNPKCDMYFIDYIQLCHGDPRKSFTYVIQEAAYGFQGLAKALGVHVCMLAQLNRDGDDESKPPRITHLKDSGAIEQAGAVIGLLWKNPEEVKAAKERAEMEGRPYLPDMDPINIDLILGKTRDGAKGTVKLEWIPPYTRFEGYPVGVEYV